MSSRARTGSRGPASKRRITGGRSTAKHAPAAGPLSQAGQAAALLGTDDGPPDRSVGPLSAEGLLALQETAGNDAVSQAIQNTAQRVPVDTGEIGETLYRTSPGARQRAIGEGFGLRGRYELTRDDDDSVSVTVRIRFLARQRVLPDDAPEEARRPTELPEEHQDWARDMAKRATDVWNGRLVFVGEEYRPLVGNQIRPRDEWLVTKRLPVKFKSEPLFGLADEDRAHKTVYIHPPSVIGGSEGNPIDAGNYYMRRNEETYPASEDLIYAHEYGHLLGIADEYSQSNQQMNLLLHGASSSKAANRLAALDRATLERMALASLSRPLYAQLQAAMPAVSNAVRAMRPAVQQRLSAAAREGIVADEVRDALKQRLGAGAADALESRIPEVVAFQTTRNFSARRSASVALERGFSMDGLAQQIGSVYWRAVLAPHQATVNLAGFDSVAINVHGDVFATSGSGGPVASEAAAVAEEAVGPGHRPGLPQPPPSSLAGRLSALPAGWSAAGSRLETDITPESFAAKMLSILNAAEAAAAVPAPPGAATAPRITRMRELYTRALAMVRNSSNEASRQLVTELINDTVRPTLEASVSELQATITTEVNRLLTSTPEELAANPAPDANMAAVVSGMKSRLDASKAALAGTDMNPLRGEGATTPSQEVSYSAQGLMGSNESAELRADQFSAMLERFNKSLRTAAESKFRAEVR